MEALATVPTPHGDCHCARFFPSAEFASAAFPERDREGERESEREREREREGEREREREREREGERRCARCVPQGFA